MAILKFLNDVTDFDQHNMVLSTDGNYFDATRVAYGHIGNVGETFSASWPEPAGNTVWIHYLHGQSTTSNQWDDFGVPVFVDANGTEVMRVDITNGVVQFVLFGDTSPSQNFAATSGSSRMFDIQFTKNGTTDLTVNVYVNGVLQVNNLTAANTLDKGVPTSMVTVFEDSTLQGVWYFGECVIADEDTRGWRLRQHRSTSYGTEQDWTGSPDAVVDARRSTGISSNTLDDRASFGLSNLEDIPIGAVIDRVCIQSVLQRGSTGLASFNHFFRYDDGVPTIDDDVDVSVATQSTEYISEYTTSPKSGVAWTDTEMAGLQAGVRART